MNKIVLSFILILLAITNVYGDAKKDMAVCSIISDDALRLMCFDELSNKLGIAKPIIETSTGNGKWEVRKEQSQIDDSTNVWVSLGAENSVYSSYKVALPKLYIRCNENKTTLFITYGDLFLGSDSIDVLTRFDKKKATTNVWIMSTDHSAIFVRGHNITFIKKLMKHDKLLVQLTPYGDSPIMTTFDIRGLKEAIKPLRKNCGW